MIVVRLIEGQTGPKEYERMSQDLGSIMRQAQKMQSKIGKIQEDFSDRKVEASTGGGMVVAVVNGNHELLELRISPEVVNAEDTEMLQEMIVGAVNQAMKSASEMVNSEIEKVTGGIMNIFPGLF
jgi:nucleoid-associated protein EbfC